MSKLTGTHSEVSEIDFTTLTTVPGTLKVHGAPIQILDLRGFRDPYLSHHLDERTFQPESLRVLTMVVVVVAKACSHLSRFQDV